MRLPEVRTCGGGKGARYADDLGFSGFFLHWSLRLRSRSCFPGPPARAGVNRVRWCPIACAPSVSIYVNPAIGSDYDG